MRNKESIKNKSKKKIIKLKTSQSESTLPDKTGFERINNIMFSTRKYNKQNLRYDDIEIKNSNKYKIKYMINILQESLKSVL